MDFSEELALDEEQFQQGIVTKAGDLLALAKDFKAQISEELNYISKCKEGRGYSDAETAIRRLYGLITKDSPFIRFWNENSYLRNSREQEAYMSANDGIDKNEKRNVLNMVEFMKACEPFRLDLMAFFQNIIPEWFEYGFKLVRADAELKELLGETTISTIAEAFREYIKLYDDYTNWSAYRKKLGRVGNEHLEATKEDILVLMASELGKTNSLKDFLVSPQQVDTYVLNFLMSIDLKTFVVGANYKRHKGDYETAMGKLKAMDEECSKISSLRTDEATYCAYAGLRSIYLEFLSFLENLFKILDDADAGETAPYRVARLENQYGADCKRIGLGVLYDKWADGTNLYNIVKKMPERLNYGASMLAYYTP